MWASAYDLYPHAFTFPTSASLNSSITGTGITPRASSAGTASSRVGSHNFMTVDTADWPFYPHVYHQQGRQNKYYNMLLPS
jgi:hypothetical protein